MSGHVAQSGFGAEQQDLKTEIEASIRVLFNIVANLRFLCHKIISEISHARTRVSGCPPKQRDYYYVAVSAGILYNSKVLLSFKFEQFNHRIIPLRNLVSTTDNSITTPIMELNTNPEKTRFFFIRHGQTDHNKAKILQGHLDTSLNEEGQLQAKTIGSAVSPFLASIDHIYSSDLQRCQQTTAAIVAHEGYSAKDVTYDSKFRERFMGEIQGMHVDQAVEYAEAQGKSHYKEFGELPHAFNDRILKLIEELKHVKGKNIIVVSHGGFIRALLKNLGFQNTDFIVYNTSVTAVEFDHQSGKFEILKVGDTSHLGEGEFKVADYRVR
ncbi:hypothetical protein WICPIJ_009326 [Wickerhamomyces pijperi]|uniref:Uncharacterized protein n=1 Tax=Wickerhamomyces pijperi TaxID=599730 RepID=A0A9P8PP34_WICPI|nr:hypothetical protein WICPIJ_009326 [Wickerhamomyces pijperi]